MKYLFTLLMLLPFPGFTQNLVPNGSFEDTLACPYTIGQLEFALHWINPTNSSPELLHNCSSFPGITLHGYQAPHTGNAYAGIYIGNPIGQLREYIEVQLLDTLTGGQCYQLGFYASAGHYKYTTDAIQAYFSDTLIDNMPNGHVLNYNTQINNPAGNFLDTLNWTYIFGEFEAIGGESYLMIGNFDSSQNCTWILMDSNAVSAPCYALIDDIELIASTCVGLGEKNHEEFEVFPIPTSNFINIKTKRESTFIFLLYNSLSEQIRSIYFRSDSRVDLTLLNSGVYFYQIFDDKSVLKKGKIIKVE